ncbi:cell wall metabolism sensor histidine kinase WalK, partial [Escherichia coli]|uniref:cell wall metabolism sensor histidine kinase WalK n=1 Tax=Escherichia coli TaxID=562 RepID=UPI0013D44317
FVYVDSEEGKGTTFSIFLPRLLGSEAEAHAETHAAAHGPAKEAAAEPKAPRPDLTGQGTILLVEDEE